jgi:hypothetical protein
MSSRTVNIYDVAYEKFNNISVYDIIKINYSKIMIF